MSDEQRKKYGRNSPKHYDFKPVENNSSKSRNIRLAQKPEKKAPEHPNTGISNQPCRKVSEYFKNKL